MKYRKKPIVVDATQWFKSGDHPKDDRETFISSDGKPFLGEGKVVRYYRTPDRDGQSTCDICGDIMHNHGWIDTLEAGHNVCPGDWIITGAEDEHYPCKPSIFAATYETADNARTEGVYSTELTAEHMEGTRVVIKPTLRPDELGD